MENCMRLQILRVEDGLKSRTRFFLENGTEITDVRAYSVGGRFDRYEPIRVVLEIDCDVVRITEEPSATNGRQVKP
jgi:hypothetical protein